MSRGQGEFRSQRRSKWILEGRETIRTGEKFAAQSYRSRLSLDKEAMKSDEQDKVTPTRKSCHLVLYMHRNITEKSSAPSRRSNHSAFDGAWGMPVWIQYMWIIDRRSASRSQDFPLALIGRSPGNESNSEGLKRLKKAYSWMFPRKFARAWFCYVSSKSAVFDFVIETLLLFLTLLFTLLHLQIKLIDRRIKNLVKWVFLVYRALCGNSLSIFWTETEYAFIIFVFLSVTATINNIFKYTSYVDV